MFKQFIQQTTYRFKRFLNKGYAAFCSMHKHVTIGRVSAHITELELLKAGKLCLLPLLLCPAATLLADDALPDSEVDATRLQLQEVSVVAERSQFQSESFRVVTNLSASDIQALPVKTVSDLLKYLPGVDLRERGASGIQADLSMRGGTGKQVIVLLNGVNITDSQTEHYSLDIPVDMALVERIEVLQGTNYALDAFSGAINIITKKGGENLLYGSMAAGQYAQVNPVLAGQLSRKNFFGNASVSYNRSNGYMHDTDYKLFNAFLETGGRGFDFQAGAQMKNAGASNFYAVGNANQYDATRTAFLTLSYQHTWGNWALDANVYYRGHYDAYQYYRDGRNMLDSIVPNAAAYNNVHWTHTTGAHAVGSWNNEWNKLSLGIDLRDEYIHSTNLGEHNRFNLRYFAEERMYFEKFSLALGANGNWNSQFGSDWGIGANMGYMPLRNLNFFLNFNRSIRVPNFTDLYYKQKRADGQYVRFADENTKPEKAMQLELSARYTYKHFYFTAAGYYRWGRDIIDWVKENDDNIVTYRSVNHSKVNAAGAELTLGLSGYKWLRKVELSYAFCDVKADAGDMLSLYALDYLRHKALLRIDHQLYKGLGATWCLRFEDREGSFSTLNGTTENYKPVWLLDGAIYWKNPWARVSVECKNMTAQTYYDNGGVLQPQEWVVAKVEFWLRKNIKH